MTNSKEYGIINYNKKRGERVLDFEINEVSNIEMTINSNSPDNPVTVTAKEITMTTNPNPPVPKEKLELVKILKGAIETSLNLYLDKIYNLTDKYFDENGDLKSGLTPDLKLEKMLKSTRRDASNYEKVRRKIIDSDYESLTLVDINYIALSLIYQKESMNQAILDLNKTQEQLVDIIKVLTDNQTE